MKLRRRRDHSGDASCVINGVSPYRGAIYGNGGTQDVVGLFVFSEALDFGLEGIEVVEEVKDAEQFRGGGADIGKDHLREVAHGFTFFGCSFEGHVIYPFRVRLQIRVTGGLQISRSW